MKKYTIELADDLDSVLLEAEEKLGLDKGDALQIALNLLKFASRSKEVVFIGAWGEEVHISVTSFKK